MLSAKVFHLTSHFAPAPISRELLLRSLGMEDKRKLADAINRLCELGLVQEGEGGRIIVHRLLREFAHTHTAKVQDIKESAEDVAKAMRKYATESNKSGLPILGADLEHLRYIAGEAEKRETVSINGAAPVLHHLFECHLPGQEHAPIPATGDAPGACQIESLDGRPVIFSINIGVVQGLLKSINGASRITGETPVGQG